MACVLKELFMDKLLLFDTSIGTDNIGDFIIMDYCRKYLSETECGNMFVWQVPTHLEIGATTHFYNKNAKYSILCGTNILKTTLLVNRIWKLGMIDILKLKNICTMGVGWNNYTSFPVDPYTKFVYKRILANDMLLSVRDRYTEIRLKEMGIDNVIYTACPTMWGLSPEHCNKIPKEKASNVVASLTFYKHNVYRDRQMLDILLRNYNTVYFFPQQYDDYDYIYNLGYIDKVIMLKPSLSCYDDILAKGNIDFVGSRLHGGIRALNAGCRTIIISVDNRATEIKKDTNLPVIEREDMDSLDNLINSKIETKLDMPWKNITKWKNQFR